jgi:stage II sporulation protein D
MLGKPGARTAILLAACAVAAGASLGVAPNAHAATWVIRGHGAGHGVGMSQYGAYGLARHGRSYQAILGHYYRDTRVATTRNSKTKVLLDSGDGSVSFRRATSACGKRLRQRRSYAFDDSGSGVTLRRSGGGKLASCGRSGTARSQGTIRIAGRGPYRGDLRATASRGALLVINVVGLNAYVKGVVPNEMPSSWSRAALAAQAVAARSYALSTSGRGPFDVYDDARSQVYGGKASEVGATNRACKLTSGKVVEFRGRVATTYFSSSSGGRTESVQFGFPGSDPVPYLKSVRDPYDGISPDHDWRVRYSQSSMESRLRGLFAGRLRRIKVLRRGDSPRIVLARVVGSKGSSRISGPGLQARLNLKSTWMRFVKR